jgi:predicted transcriptional regulator
MILKKRFLFILLLIILINCSLSLAIDYYADVDIYVKENGLVSIEGITNHPSLSVEDVPDFTSKQGKFWTFNISLSNFSDYVYRLHLPKGSLINYMNLPNIARIEHSEKHISIIGTAINKDFNIVVQYEINRENSKNYYFLGIILILLLGVSYFFYNKKKKKKKVDIGSLTERQKLIFDVLKKNKKPMTQKQIQNKLNLPKSSISRNINSMVRKGILGKNKIGISNKVFIKGVANSSGKFRQK